MNGLGWEAPYESFDYRRFADIAANQCEVLRRLMERLQKERPRSQERELLRRRELRILTDMYYEQRGNAKLFAAKAERRA